MGKTEFGRQETDSEIYKADSENKGSDHFHLNIIQDDNREIIDETDGDKPYFFKKNYNLGHRSRHWPLTLFLAMVIIYYFCLDFCTVTIQTIPTDLRALIT